MTHGYKDSNKVKIIHELRKRVDKGNGIVRTDIRDYTNSV